MLAFLALQYGLASLTYVSGKRNRVGRVVSGSEIITSIRPIEILLDLELAKISEFLPIHQYRACLQVIDGIKQHEELLSGKKKRQVEELEHWIMGLFHWDLFNHDLAMQEFRKLESPPLEHIRWLDILKEERVRYSKKIPELKGEVPTPALIVDLLANAERRALEGNYDDGIARLYRVIEMIGQFSLINTFNLNPSDIDMEQLKRINGEIGAKYQHLKNNEGRIQLALMNCFELLSDLSQDSSVATISRSNADNLRKCHSAR